MRYERWGMSIWDMINYQGAHASMKLWIGWFIPHIHIAYSKCGDRTALPTSETKLFSTYKDIRTYLICFVILSSLIKVD